MSGITVFDFDDIDCYNRMIQEHPELESCLRVKTLKGFHIYFNYNSSVLTTTNGLINYNNVDIRNDDSIVFCPPTKYKLLNGTVASYELLEGNLIDVPDYLLVELKCLQQKTKKLKKLREVEPIDMSENETDNEELQDNEEIQNEVRILLDCLDESRASNYHDWVLIGMIVKQVLGSSGWNLFTTSLDQCGSKCHRRSERPT